MESMIVFKEGIFKNVCVVWDIRAFHDLNLTIVKYDNNSLIGRIPS
jgi:hypothetical protein